MAKGSAVAAATQFGTDDWSGPLAMADTLIGIGGLFAASPPALLARVLQDFADPAAVDPLMAAGLLDPATLFDGFTTVQLIGLRPLLDRAFDVVAYPRQRLPRLQPGDLLLRRALAEPGLGHVAFIAGEEAYPRDEAHRRGLWLESMRPGHYGRVVEPGSHPHRLAHRFARRIATAEGTLPADTLILRPRLRNRFHRVTAELAEDVDTDAPRPLAPTVPGAAGRQNGIDVYSGNNLPAMNDIKDAGIRFIVHKCSERTAAGTLINDASFTTRWNDTGAAELIRGSFHYYRHVNGAAGNVPANLVVAQVVRLLPGDLAPALDFENDAVSTGSSEPSASDWATELGEFLDTLEIKLGRTPLVYTSVSAWTSHISGKRDFGAADFAKFNDYPLWVKEYGGPRFVTLDDLDNPPAPGAKPIKITVDLDTPPKPLTRTFRRAAADRANAQYGQRQTLRPNLPRSWTNWTILQYSPFTPGSLLGNHPFSEMSIDFDVSNGGLYSLRGLADLGRTAPHLVGNLSCIAYAEGDGRIFLLEFLSGSWRNTEVLANVKGAPAIAGDPAAVGLGNEEIIVYRGEDAHVHALSRKLTEPGAVWSPADVGGNAVGDPFLMVLGNEIHVVYWDSSDHQAHVVRKAGAWQAGDLAAVPGAPSASGAAVAYAHSDGVHIVARAGDAGHLIDLFRLGGVPVNEDLTATARDDQNNPPPAATYRPATYTPRGRAVRIVFRALHGPIWLIERDTLRARNLSALAVKAAGPGAGTAGAPNAAGSPTALAADTSRVFYRAVDGTVIEIFDDVGTVRWREVCADAAADPTAYADAEGMKVSFRAGDGSIRLARFANGVWICNSATVTTSPSFPGPEMPAGIPAQQHASKILEGLHPLPASRPEPTAVLSQPIFAAASSIKATTPEYQLEANLDGGGGGGGGGGGASSSVVDPFPPTIMMSRDVGQIDFSNCIAAASQPTNVSGMCGAVVDLTDGDPVPYVGHNDTDMLYIGSLAKIYPLLAAFELRQRVTLQAKSMILLGLSTAQAGWENKVFAELKRGWQPQLDNAFPDLPSKFPTLAQVVELSPDGTAQFQANFLDWIRAALGQNDEEAAGNYIRALSYPYINGVLAAAGFFNPGNRTGLWISGDYNGNDWLPADGAGLPLTARWQKSPHVVSNFTGTALQVVRFLGLMAQGKLVNSTPPLTGATSAEMMDLLGVPWLKKTLENHARQFTSANGKVGIGTWDARFHDGAIVRIERDGDPTRTISYALAVLGSPEQGLEALRLFELAYHDCVVARHP